MRLALREMQAQENKTTTWSELCTHFEMHLRNRLEIGEISKKSFEDYLAAIRNHTFNWTNLEFDQISAFDCEQLFTSLKQQQYSSGHIRRLKGVISKVFELGIKLGLSKTLTRSPTFGIKIKKVQQEKKPETLSLAEIKLLLSKAKELNSPWYPIWAMALLTGMRSGELYALTWDDVDFQNREITISKSYCRRSGGIIKSTKAGYWRTVPISKDLHSLLRELKLNSAGRESALPRLTAWKRSYQAKELRKFCMGIGLKPIKFHTLRALFATQLIREGIAPIVIQKICGWRDLETMQRYIRLAGIETKGATNSLEILPSEEALEKVSALLKI